MANSRRKDAPGDAESGERVRLDQWLWAARFFKTRALAAQAVEGGKVDLNEARPKRAHPVRPGDRLRVRHGPQEYRITVVALSARRGPAVAAAGLYEEEPESVVRRAAVAARLRAEAAVFGHHEGRPTKKDRRAIAKARKRL